MNIIKKFMDSGVNRELAVVPSGVFNLIRSQKSPKSSLECISHASALTIREIGQFHYELVIKKLLDNTEEDNDDENDGYYSDDALSVLSTQSKKDENWSFTLGENLKFHKLWSDNGDIVFVWNNVLGDETDEKVQFVIDNDSVPMNDIENFLQILYRCYYQTVNQKTIVKATDEDIRDIELLLNNPNLGDIDNELSKNLEVLTVNSESESDEDNNDKYEDAIDTITIRKEILEAQKEISTAHIKKNKVKQDTIKGENLGSFETNLYLFDPIKEEFMLQETSITANLIELGKYKYWFAIGDDSSANQLGTFINNDLFSNFDDLNLAFIFNYGFKNITLSYMIKFFNIASFKEFKVTWSSLLWMSSNRLPWDKLSDKDKHFIINPKLNIVKDLDNILGFTDGDDLLEKQRIEKEKIENEANDEYDDEYDDDDVKNLRSKKKNLFVKSEAFANTSHGNKSLTVSYRNNRSYIVRGDNIGIFKTQSEENDGVADLEYISVVKNIKGKNGIKILPENPMMYMEDRSMILADKTNTQKLYKMDIEKGIIVEEWGTGEKEIVKIGPTKKFDQLINEQTVLGVSENSLFKLDPRINTENKVVQDEMKEYKTKVKFSSIATTTNGHIAIGSDKGEIRLYDRLGVIAKTTIPSLGEPIKHICTSADGKWLLATCDKMLLLMDLTIKTGNKQGTLGFLKSFPQNENVKTYILKVSPEHSSSIVNHTKKPIKYRNAYFNSGLGLQEKNIITSIGPYAITWSLDKILKEAKTPYAIKLFDNDIVEDNFEFGSEDNVIVALKDDVSVASRKSFKHPSKKTFHQ